MARPSADAEAGTLPTTILPVQPSANNIVRPGEYNIDPSEQDDEAFTRQFAANKQEWSHLVTAAQQLQHSDVPVAFLTETVYGLGADATRSSAVRGIYRAKKRPADNPLIVHIHSLRQLRTLLEPAENHQTPSFSAAKGFPPANDSAELANRSTPTTSNGNTNWQPIPQIYHPLIRKFWPGPLTLIMPNPTPSHLAPEVTANLNTFGIRMPSNALALALLKLTDRPLAAPSANASTKPSPTTAQHVKNDLEGRISTILDGGPCDVGVESTVVDGLGATPIVLRPGGVGIEELRGCQGWEGVVVGYKDAAEGGATSGSATNGTEGTGPRAPGMKYKHYSPRAPVILFEHPSEPPSPFEMTSYLERKGRIGIVRTKHWPFAVGYAEKPLQMNDTDSLEVLGAAVETAHEGTMNVLDVRLGEEPERIARGLFSALRSLDEKEVDAILVEGIDDSGAARGGAAAVMNRLRKAATRRIDGR
ncbi:MAG: hypothetical protein M1831_006373 [Alyxoria varia]|nr:MAG: hypothetical protein M1831_006373 [Alyxoria varia]